jgi:DNA mismatch repair ATPase MutL
MRKEYMKTYNENNKDKVLAHNKKYYQDNKDSIKKGNKEYYNLNKDKLKVAHQEYEETNRDKIKEHSKKYYDDNKDKIKKYVVEYYENNKEKIKEYSKKNYKDNKDKFRERNLKKSYGIDSNQFEQMLTTQNNKCIICDKAFGKEKINKPHIDHDHETNKVRSLLCTKCNLGIGLFDEDISRIEKVITYLKKWE